MILIVHVLLGFRRLREIDYYRDDPMVQRTLHLNRLPDVSTICRCLHSLNEESYENVRKLSKDLVLENLDNLRLARLTVDFDGSVLWTKSQNTEGTAIGYNPKKKGTRSYYPLFSTIAQIGQVLDVLHRPGNVHDSNGAESFIKETFNGLRKRYPKCALEGRLDSAHFSDRTCFWLDDNDIEFSISVPFERFTELKSMIENKKHWHRIDDSWSYFEIPWKPKSWNRYMSFVFYRHKVPLPRKGTIRRWRLAWCCGLRWTDAS